MLTPASKPRKSRARDPFYEAECNERFVRFRLRCAHRHGGCQRYGYGVFAEGWGQSGCVILAGGETMDMRNQEWLCPEHRKK